MDLVGRGTPGTGWQICLQGINWEACVSCGTLAVRAGVLWLLIGREGKPTTGPCSENLRFIKV